MFVNLSNHASRLWSEKQLNAAKEYGEILDMTFPDIDPYDSSSEIDAAVDRYFREILQYGRPVVMLQGEFLFTYRLVRKLKEAGIKVVAGCSKRCSVEQDMGDGKIIKKSEFEFVQFKEY